MTQSNLAPSMAWSFNAATWGDPRGIPGHLALRTSRFDSFNAATWGDPRGITPVREEKPGAFGASMRPRGVTHVEFCQDGCPLFRERGFNAATWGDPRGIAPSGPGPNTRQRLQCGHVG